MTTKRELAERLTNDRDLYFRQLLGMTKARLWEMLADRQLSREQRRASAERSWANYVARRAS